MSPPLTEMSCARMPREALPLLAGLRAERGVQAALTERHAWVRWEAGNEHVLQAVLPIHGAVLYGFQDGRWHLFGQALPAFDFPAHLDYQPLAHVLFPAPVQPIRAMDFRVLPLHLSLQRDGQPRKTTALLGPLAVLLQWSDAVPKARLASLQGVYLGEQALVFGDYLPLLADSTRFWGRDVLIPLGYAPDPDLPESALKQASGLEADEILLWQPGHAEVIDRTLLAPLTRAGLRLAGSLPSPSGRGAGGEG